MAATLTVPPPALAYSKDPIWVVLNTSLISLVSASVTLTISSTGPSATETLAIVWPGYSLTFTVAASPDGSGLQIPTKGAESLSVYADRVVEYLRRNEILHENFLVTHEAPVSGNEIVRITRRVLEKFSFTSVTETLSNVTATTANVTTDPIPANLRALVEVWEDTGTTNADTRLLHLHAPYQPSAVNTAEIDLSAAFADLAPTLPDADSIPPAAVPPSAVYHDVAASFKKYYLRTADKKGSPPVAEALVKSAASYLVLHGSKSPEADSSDVTRLAHNYRTRAGATLVKPVSEDQPDWVFYMPLIALPTAFISCKLYWSDGSETTYAPSFSGYSMNLEADKLYWFVSGYRQLRLDLVTPPTTGAYIIAYDWRLGPQDEDELWRATVNYEVHPLVADWGMYLLYDNGVGGCESVWLKGKASAGYEVQGEMAQRPRGRFWTVDAGEFDPYALDARATWEISTGWQEQDYIEHLRQLPLAERCWLIDMRVRRFLRVLVEPKKVDGVREDDRDLHELTFTVRAAWRDVASNL